MTWPPRNHRAPQPGDAIAVGACGNCSAVFVFDPGLVPAVNGVQVCKDCVDAVNPERQRRGLPLIAYDAKAYVNEDDPCEHCGQPLWDKGADRPHRCPSFARR